MKTKWLILAALVIPGVSLANPYASGVKPLTLVTSAKASDANEDATKPRPKKSPPPKKKTMQALDQQQEITAESKAQMERRSWTSGNADTTGTSIEVQKQSARTRQENQKPNRTEQNRAQQATQPKKGKKTKS